MKRFLCIFIALVAFMTVLELRSSEPLTKIVVRVPTQAGDSLWADAWVTSETTPKPVILVQTPYNKIAQDLRKGNPSDIARIYFDTASFHYVIMDWRGLYTNASVARSNYDRGLDGYDVIEWIAKQSWCDGKIGTYGSSALGLIQFQTMVHNPPHLVCAAPFAIDYKNDYGDFYDGGSYREEYVKTISSLGFTSEAAILEHPTEDLFWKLAANQTDISDRVGVPLLMMTGWYDHFPGEVIRAFGDLREKSDVSVKNKHKLVIGPWTHTGIGIEKQGELNFPEAVDLSLAKVRQFFGHYLLGEKNNWEAIPNITYFQMGDNVWLTTESWKNPDSKFDTLYAAYPNELVFEKSEIPEITEQKLSYIYNPRDPSPTVGGSRFNRQPAQYPPGPMDISQKVESRNDCVILTTKPFQNKYSIRGKTIVKLSIESDKTDTDFGVRLTDVHPDGKSIILTQGMRRARFRKSVQSQTLLTPDSPDSVEIELPDLAHAFIPGHSLRIVISSSNYPMFSLNPNDGGELYKAADTIIANNTIRFGKAEATYIVLPVSEVNSVKERANKEARIFPNPAGDIVFVEGEFASLPEIFDIYGKEIVITGKNAVGGVALNVSELTTGLYFIRCDDKTYKLIKK